MSKSYKNLFAPVIPPMHVPYIIVHPIKQKSNSATLSSSNTSTTPGSSGTIQTHSSCSTNITNNLEKLPKISDKVALLKSLLQEKKKALAIERLKVIAHELEEQKNLTELKKRCFTIKLYSLHSMELKNATNNIINIMKKLIKNSAIHPTNEIIQKINIRKNSLLQQTQKDIEYYNNFKCHNCCFKKYLDQDAIRRHEQSLNKIELILSKINENSLSSVEIFQHSKSKSSSSSDRSVHNTIIHNTGIYLNNLRYSLYKTELSESLYAIKVKLQNTLAVKCSSKYRENIYEIVSTTQTKIEIIQELLEKNYLNQVRNDFTELQQIVKLNLQNIKEYANQKKCFLTLSRNKELNYIKKEFQDTHSKLLPELKEKIDCYHNILHVNDIGIFDTTTGDSLV